jgi:uncharacterized protein YndB with AHSA1/START domain
MMAVEEIDQTTLVVQRVFEAPIEAVFKAWTDPELLPRWYTPVDGWVVSKAEVDLRPGGEFHLEFGPPGGDPVVEIGTYEEIAPPKLLVFTIRLLGRSAVEPTRCRVEFTDQGDRTEVKIVEGRYSTKTVRDMHAGGWSHCLDLLEVLLRD